MAGDAKRLEIIGAQLKIRTLRTRYDVVYMLPCCGDAFRLAMNAERLPIEVRLSKGLPQRRGIEPSIVFISDALPADRLPVLAALIAAAGALDDPVTSWAVAKCFHVTTLIPSRRFAVRLSLVAVVSVT